MEEHAKRFHGWLARRVPVPPLWSLMVLSYLAWILAIVMMGQALWLVFEL
jgi:hypothetical protein